MALTPSTMLALGNKAVAFNLTDAVSGKDITLDDIRGKSATLVMFICNHCPYVVHIRESLAKLGNEYVEKGIGVVAISSNDAKKYPDDSPEQLKAMAKKFKFQFPFLYDQSQEVAKAYQAACTPDFFLYDKDLKLVYRGQFDESRPGNDKPITGQDLRTALDSVLAGKTPDPNQQPSMGCNIKWKPGNEPVYFGR